MASQHQDEKRFLGVTVRFAETDACARPISNVERARIGDCLHQRPSARDGNVKFLLDRYSA